MRTGGSCTWRIGRASLGREADAVRAIAPAKINWTLEALGRRDDGYHEIRTVMQTIDLHDGLIIEAAPALTMEVTGPHTAWDDDLVLRAARNLREVARLGTGAVIHLAKEIPVAAGLGGGSSDAAATLRCLDRLWGLGMTEAALAGVAAEVSSDAPFFMRGGTAMAEGRGERVTPLRDAPEAWLVLLVPPLKVAEKTRRMYGALTPADFTDGSRTTALVQRIRGGAPVSGESVYNAFERAAYDVFGGLGEYRRALLDAGASAVHLAGSGPALFSLAGSQAGARGILSRLRAPGGRALTAKTTAAGEATACG